MNRKDFFRNMFTTSGVVALGPSLQALAEFFPEEGEVMPAFFIGHGSPMNALEDNVFVRGWKTAMASVAKPKAILCVSAHWLTRGTLVTAMEQPKTIHDFGGFPKQLFEALYPAPGSPLLAKCVRDSVKAIDVQLDQDWGLDHGTWSVLNPVFPKADIPVIQVSIDISKPGEWHYTLGKELAQLRRRGVMIIGSGNMVHNLRMIDFKMERKGFDWALEIDEVFKQHVLRGNHTPLLDYKKLGKAATLAIPTPDHYYPLLYTLALQSRDEPVTIFNDEAVMGSLTMTSVKIG